MTGRPVHSVVVIPLPEASVLTAPWRRPRALDAHITIAAPFLDPSGIDDHVVTALSACLAHTTSFDVVFQSVDWFDQRVVYVAPDDPAPFVHLARTLTKTFPASTSGGDTTTYIPHLTVAKNRAIGELRTAAAASATLLPLHTRAREVVLFLFDVKSSAWRERARVPLAPLA